MLYIPALAQEGLPKWKVCKKVFKLISCISWEIYKNVLLNLCENQFAFQLLDNLISWSIFKLKPLQNSILLIDPHIWFVQVYYCTSVQWLKGPQL